jgi:hypothetical protein
MIRHLIPGDSHPSTHVAHARPLASALALTTGLAFSAAAPGGVARAAAQAVPELDSVRLLADLSVLAHDSMEGREAGSLGSLRARHFLERQLEEAGVLPIGSTYAHAFSFPRARVRTSWGWHPDGIPMPRSSSSPRTTITWASEGRPLPRCRRQRLRDRGAARDRRVQLARPPHHTDRPRRPRCRGDRGLRGARAFVDAPPVPLERVALNVNLDMVARTDGVLWAAGAHHTPALRPILEEVAGRAPMTLRLGHDRPDAPEGDDWTGSSDHSAFHAEGIPFVYFGVEDHADYHRPTDDFERVDPAELFASVRTILLAVRALDAALPLVPARP